MFFQRRESRHLKSGRNQKAVASNILEAIAQLGGGSAAEDGLPSTRMKIVIRKEDLKQLLDTIRDGGTVCRAPPSTPAATSLEQRLHLLRRRQILRGASQAKGRSGVGPWMPVLQSIPEEL